MWSELVKDAINFACRPALLFCIWVGAFVATLRWRYCFTRGRIGLVCLALFAVFVLFSMGDPAFQAIVGKPDNSGVALLVLGAGFFYWFGLRQAVESDRLIAAGERLDAPPRREDFCLVWPHLVYIELVAMVLVTVLLLVWSLLIPAPLEEPANPTLTPNPSKAPWYFLGLQELLVYFDPWLAGVVFPGLIIVGLMAIPYLDRNSRGNGHYTFEQRPLAHVLFFFGFFILWTLLIAYGTFLRGPNWNFFGPYEVWDPNKVVPLTNVDLSELFWSDLLGWEVRPTAIAVREAPGTLMLFALFVGAPALLARTRWRALRGQIGWWRYWTFSFLLAMMMLLPLKMLLRWTLNVKYLVALPEFFFNV